MSTTSQLEYERLNGVIGKHVYGNLYGVDPNILSDEKFLRSLVIKAAEIANVHLVEVKSWKFINGDKEGVSVLALVVESHIAIHTWPVYRFATVDVYTCGDHSMPDKAFNYIVSVLKPRRYIVNYADRSSE
ncbi:adenosylmethionine decarboxylase [Vulcanisaeta distributa]|uniref:Arginine decarboxylase proenzyme n=1 Tax=Vulcanisaeta distributa (strain DSM 14429 / JCM 11212 / NBRC 100878 / IC-017) TaxID=572478 RepID=E1QV36_VULDI|nr:adenosylmethionine decarboxylase [Vulcanisaeta distributa]ADN51227.1 S-adenosylmethionine decarboxylase proenzyme [Vulcanisaeta distributa DSM 14429]